MECISTMKEKRHLLYTTMDKVRDVIQIKRCRKGYFHYGCISMTFYKRQTYK